MIRKLRSPLSDHVRIVFELPSCLWADRIYLVGDFNQWDQRATPMQQDRDGVWRAMIDLKWGAHAEFRYLIDGQWRTDYHADGQMHNEFGSENSVVYAQLDEEVYASTGATESKGNDVPEVTRNAVTVTKGQPLPGKTTPFQPRRRTAQPVRVAA